MAGGVRSSITVMASDWWTPEVLEAATAAVRAQKTWDGMFDVKPVLRAIAESIVPRTALEDDQVGELFASAVAQGFHAEFSLDASYWGREYQERLLALLDRLTPGACPPSS